MSTGDWLKPSQALPIVRPDPWDLSTSLQVLVALRWGDFAVAYLQRWPWQDDEPEPAVWRLAGHDAYSLEEGDIVAWRDLPEFPSALKGTP